MHITGLRKPLSMQSRETIECVNLPETSKLTAVSSSGEGALTPAGLLDCHAPPGPCLSGCFCMKAVGTLRLG